MIWGTKWGKWVGTSLAVAALIAAGLTVMAWPSPTSASGRFQGKTSKGLTVSFHASNGEVHAFKATVHARCFQLLDHTHQKSPAPDRRHITPKAMRLAADGTFKAEYKTPEAEEKVKIEGKLNGTSASGRYSIEYTISSQSMMGNISIPSTLVCRDAGTWEATGGAF